jgi:hypothetical protein
VQAAVDDHGDLGDGQAGLGHVRGDDDATAGGLLQDALLLVEVHAPVKGMQFQVLLPAIRSQDGHRPPDLPQPGHEDEHGTVEALAHELLEGGQRAFGRAAARIERMVADGDGEHPTRHFHLRRLRQIAGQRFVFQGRRHDGDLGSNARPCAGRPGQSQVPSRRAHGIHRGAPRPP